MTILVSGSPTLAEPAGHLIWEIGISVTAVVLVLVGIWRWRHQGSPRLLLMVVASASVAWQETYGDWGAYVLYSERFLTYSWPSDTWTGSIKCWWWIAGYAVFYPTLYGLLTAGVAYVRRRHPERNIYLVTILLAVPLFYLFDLCFEATMVYLGYWNYVHTFGPALHVGNGTFPLLWPILEQVPFIALATVAIEWRDGRGDDFFERTARRITTGRRRAVALFGVWIALTNVEFLFLTTLPLMALRWIAGPDIPV